MPFIKRIVGDVVIISSICVGYCVSIFTIMVVGENMQGFLFK